MKHMFRGWIYFCMNWTSQYLPLPFIHLHCILSILKSKVLSISKFSMEILIQTSKCILILLFIPLVKALNFFSHFSEKHQQIWNLICRTEREKARECRKCRRNEKMPNVLGKNGQTKFLTCIMRLHSIKYHFLTLKSNSQTFWPTLHTAPVTGNGSFHIKNANLRC